MLEYARMYHGATELRRLYRGSTLLWEKPEAAAGLAPWGTNWLLYGRADDAVMAYLQPGIYLHSPARWIAYGFTCAESPEKVDFTRIKNVRAYGSFVSDPSWNLLGGIAALPYTHSTHLNESITATKLVVAAAGSSFIDLDCTGIGGNQILLLYADMCGNCGISSILQPRSSPAIRQQQSRRGRAASRCIRSFLAVRRSRARCSSIQPVM